ncbi:MAG: sigma-70 family RNA polymerase sigma factor [Candidatus Brocadia sp.]|jgi:RNA polymerase sigma factor, sigma-70 family|uniref:RNA polymerase sigma factor n=1 Tax=Candidatus Brocadia fulgida TaxID=380242 RepID=A0A0M2UT50_9BACT|nr:MAG: RNA polymerase sigma factor [Candidatus Brocadia fulgida]UJS22397.1 MAG: sigma-70 family RNA polymerase sigma factor [Candidatus Brocadia sp.]
MDTNYFDMVGRIYSENHEKLINYARKHYPILKQEEIEDVVHDVSIEIIKMIQALSKTGNSIDKKLVIGSFYKRVRCRCIDRGRKKQEESKEEGVLDNKMFKKTNSGIPSEQKWFHPEDAPDNINKEKLNIAMSKMEQECLKTIKLFYLSEASLSHREIANELQISEENSRKRLSRCMKTLKKYFDKEINKI